MSEGFPPASELAVQLTRTLFCARAGTTPSARGSASSKAIRFIWVFLSRPRPAQASDNRHVKACTRESYLDTRALGFHVPVDYFRKEKSRTSSFNPRRIAAVVWPPIGVALLQQRHDRPRTRTEAHDRAPQLARGFGRQMRAFAT
jgi:hypothetical protein